MSVWDVAFALRRAGYPELQGVPDEFVLSDPLDIEALKKACEPYFRELYPEDEGWTVTAWSKRQAPLKLHASSAIEALGLLWLYIQEKAPH